MGDEFTRKNLARRLGRSITAEHVTIALDEACAARGAPAFLRCDNGPEFVPADSLPVPSPWHGNLVHRPRKPLAEPYDSVRLAWI